jgi:ABC-type spermidine/putrescine transport system permease subunit I
MDDPIVMSTEEEEVVGAPPNRWNAASATNYLLIAPLLFLSIFFLWPLTNVVFRSFWGPNFGIHNYVELFTRPAYFRVFAYTFEISFSITVLCLVLSYPVAIAIARAKGRVSGLLLILVLVPFWTSAVIRNFSWMILLQRSGPINTLLGYWNIIDTPLALINNSIGVQIGMVHVLTPFMILPMVTAFKSIDATYMQAAGSLGANPIRAFWHVYVPLTMPGVAAGCSLVFIMALGFYIAPALLGGPQNTMVAVLIEQQVNVTVNWGVASAAASILLIITVLLYALYEALSTRMARRV